MSTISERARLRADISDAMSGAQSIQEGYERVQAMLRHEDRYWKPVFGEAFEDDGFTLDQLKNASAKIRESVVGAPWMKRGLGLRSSYIWQGGIQYSGVPTEGRGRGTDVQGIIDDPINQANFFGDEARRRREGCLYHDGLAAWICDENKKLRSIPLGQITDKISDPDYAWDVWAYRREWNHRDPATGESKTVARWYFTDIHADERNNYRTIKHNGNDEPVDKGSVIFVQHANRLEGCALGSPDATAAWVWNAITRDAYMDGVTMTASMATWAYKASVTTKGGADNASMKIAKPGGPGQTAVVGGPNDLTPMSNAGKGYDFNTLRGLTAIIATALDVSNIALTADPGAAGSSYGSAATLDLPTRLAMEARRMEHVEMDLRVLRWLGAKNPKAWFASLESATDVYREAQALLLLWSSGLYDSASIEARLSELLQIAENTIPDGVLIPNNKASWERADIDPKDDPNATAPSKPNATSPGQGRSSGAGKSVNQGDMRSDGLGEMRRLLERFMELEERNLKGS